MEVSLNSKRGEILAQIEFHSGRLLRLLILWDSDITRPSLRGAPCLL